MSDEQYAKLLREIDRVRSEASDKGHVIIIILLLWILISK